MHELKRILLAEDDSYDAELIITGFAQKNLANEVVVVRDGEEALDYLYYRGKYVGRTDDYPAFMKAMKPSEALAKIVGNEPLPRTVITKKLWEYIKKNNLQDAKNKRNINADENLLAVFDGNKQVSMFEMTKLVNKHLSCGEKTGRS